MPNPVDGGLGVAPKEGAPGVDDGGLVDPNDVLPPNPNPPVDGKGAPVLVPNDVACGTGAGAEPKFIPAGAGVDPKEVAGAGPKPTEPGAGAVPKAGGAGAAVAGAEPNDTGAADAGPNPVPDEPEALPKAGAACPCPNKGAAGAEVFVEPNMGAAGAGVGAADPAPKTKAPEAAGVVAAFASEGAPN